MPLKKKVEFRSAFETYTAHELVGQGGSGYVYKCQDSSENWVAIKQLSPQNVTSDRLKRFKNEVLFCQNNTHANVVRVIDDGPYVHDGVVVPFYVMPLYDSTLRNLMRQGVKQDAVLLLFAQLLDGVEAAHYKGVVHRDLKPENFLYDVTNNRVVVADFGIARFQEEELYTAVETRAQDRLANFHYAAPEQGKRGFPIDERTDIYALGLILNEMFTGDIPKGTGYKTIESVAPAFSYLDEIVARMIRQSIEERFTSIDLVKQELQVRNNEFIQRQKLSELKGIVIPSSQLDDPLIENPIQIVDFEWADNSLTLMLSQRVNNEWVWSFRNMGNFSYIRGLIEPHRFTFMGDRAVIVSREEHVQECINLFKSWVPTATATYRKRREDEKQAEEHRQRTMLQNKIAEEEAKARLKKNIKL